MSLLDDITPMQVRGVIGIQSCPDCEAPAPILGAPGKGRPLDTFAADYFCTGHVMRVGA